ncbi:MAG: hypothetical protein U0172_06120 [Nitrospiraceae bacterium]
MAQKFGNGRWVRDGFLDNRTAGTVVARLYLAGVGPVELCLRGDFKPDIAGQMIVLRNPRFEEDELAGHVLGDFESPQVGTVSLISFDPHPLLAPHPYIEWFSSRGGHYRIELQPDDAWIATEAEVAQLDGVATRIRTSLQSAAAAPAERGRAEESDWV